MGSNKKSPHYGKRTTNRGTPVSGAASFTSAVKEAGGPEAWADKVTRELREAAIRVGVEAGISAYEQKLQEKQPLSKEKTNFLTVIEGGKKAG
ncbi:hypothetical protein [Acetobacter syzygii]|uniref:Uncharacterized protein n=1 Tax=Acetobacter syzygii TaxID=146476 RepID=A0A270B4L9_9PROT|nr:hypothetical protein [Acetobacter syzygii]PAL19535.1 hypothetical protein B9K04_13685 [Acetobacter syzygii]PAL19943.1 hypothetical protein B9K05_13725 [Acetobacter syzygii]